MVLSTEWAQVEVVELSNDGNGLGFHLVGGRSTGVVVKHVVPGGAADRDARLQPGDHLLQVGAVNVRGLSAEQVAGVVRAAAGSGGARLLVARRGAPATCLPPGAALVPTRFLHDADMLHAHLLAASAPPAAPLAASPLAPPADLPSDPDVEVVSVRLRKNVYGLGITVAGYVCEREELCGIFVRSIIEGSSAERSGAVRVNDRIVAVDGVSLLALGNAQAVAVLRATGLDVHLLLERYLRGPKYDHLRLAAFADDTCAAGACGDSELVLPVAADDAVVELDLDSTTTIDSAILETGPEPDAEVKTELEAGAEAEPEVLTEGESEDISRALDELVGTDAASLRRRWLAALGAGADVVVVDVRRAADGLGISVEGTAEVVRGQERDARHFVRGLRAGGAVCGALRPGDELLQANSAVLRGAPHAAAVAALRALPAAARLVLARGAAPAAAAAVLHAPDPPRTPPRSPPRSPPPCEPAPTFPSPPHSPLPSEATPTFPSPPHSPPLPEPTVVPPSPPEAVRPLTPPPSPPPASPPPSSPAPRSRSASPAAVSGLATWHSEEEMVVLEKTASGLGFSILDYQDPAEARGTAIVVRGVVAGGAAARAGRPARGERVLSVNGRSVRGASLATAVAALKAAPRGPVRLGLARPRCTPPPSPP